MAETTSKFVLTPEIVAEQWKEDSEISETKIPQELIKTSSLHSKYLSYYLQFKRNLSTAEYNKNLMGELKKKYYSGRMTKEELDKLGWSQWQGLKQSGTEFNQLISYDKDMNKLEKVVAEANVGIKICEYILQQIDKRGYALKNLLEYYRYINGN